MEPASIDNVALIKWTGEDPIPLIGNRCFSFSTTIDLSEGQVFTYSLKLQDIKERFSCYGQVTKSSIGKKDRKVVFQAVQKDSENWWPVNQFIIDYEINNPEK